MGKFIDMTGWIMKDHGMPNSFLEVIKRDETVIGKKGQSVYWICKCHLCGNIISINTQNIKRKNNCGCRNKRVKDLTKQRFGRLVVQEQDFQEQEKHSIGTYWKCLCDCGNYTTVYQGNLTSGKVLSCGCLQEENRHKKKIDMIGKTFNYLTVLYEQEERINNKIYYHCLCRCGNECNVDGTLLRTGAVASCGCLHQSLGEEQIKNILTQNNFNFIYNKSFFKELVSNNGTPLRYDFIILENQKPIRIIEYDGEQHYREVSSWGGQDALNIRKQNDNIKNNFAISHNIPLIRIPYWERDNITLEMLLGDQYLIK